MYNGTSLDPTFMDSIHYSPQDHTSSVDPSQLLNSLLCGVSDNPIPIPAPFPTTNPIPMQAPFPTTNHISLPNSTGIPERNATGKRVSNRKPICIRNTVSVPNSIRISSPITTQTTIYTTNTNPAPNPFFAPNPIRFSNPIITQTKTPITSPIPVPNPIITANPIPIPTEQTSISMDRDSLTSIAQHNDPIESLSFLSTTNHCWGQLALPVSLSPICGTTGIPISVIHRNNTPSTSRPGSLAAAEVNDLTDCFPSKYIGINSTFYNDSDLRHFNCDALSLPRATPNTIPDVTDFGPTAINDYPASYLNNASDPFSPLPSPCVSVTSSCAASQIVKLAAEVVTRESSCSTASTVGSNKNSPLKMKQFLIKLLQSPSYNPQLIKWVDQSHNDFQLLDIQEIAKLYGIESNSKRVNNAISFKRSLRYCCTKGVLFSANSNCLIYSLQPAVQPEIATQAPPPCAAPLKSAERTEQQNSSIGPAVDTNMNSLTGLEILTGDLRTGKKSKGAESKNPKKPRKRKFSSKTHTSSIDAKIPQNCSTSSVKRVRRKTNNIVVTGESEGPGFDSPVSCELFCEGAPSDPTAAQTVNIAIHQAQCSEFQDSQDATSVLSRCHNNSNVYQNDALLNCQEACIAQQFTCQNPCDALIDGFSNATRFCGTPSRSYSSSNTWANSYSSCLILPVHNEFSINDCRTPQKPPSPSPSFSGGIRPNVDDRINNKSPVLGRPSILFTNRNGSNKCLQ